MARFGRGFMPRQLRREGVVLGTNFRPSDSDSGSSSESLVLTATASDSDSGIDADAFVLTAVPGASDSGSDSESALLTALHSASDSGSESDMPSLAAAESAIDLGAGSEVSDLAIQLLGADNGSMIEGGIPGAVTSDGDQGSQVDSGALVAAQSVTDAFSGSDLGLLSVLLLVGDAATIVENAIVIGTSDQTFVMDSDLGTLSETLALKAILAASASGQGEAEASLSAQLAALDTWSGLAEMQVVAVHARDHDIGFIEALTGALRVFVDDEDLGKFREQADLHAFGISVSDEFGGSDSGFLHVTMLDVDFSLSVDEIALAILKYAYPGAAVLLASNDVDAAKLVSTELGSKLVSAGAEDAKLIGAR